MAHTKKFFRIVCRCGLLMLLLAGRDGFAQDAEENKIRAILIRWVDALGGPQAIHDLRSVDYHCRIDHGQGRSEVKLHVRSDANGHYRYDYELPDFGRLTQAYDGRVRWQHNDQLGSGQLSEQEHMQNVLGINFRSPLKVGGNYPYKKLLPDETITGKTLQVLEMKDRFDIRSKWYFDPATGHRVRLELPDVPGGSLLIEYSDFRRVGNVKEAFQVIRSQGDRRNIITTEAIIYNEEVDPILLSPPLDFVEETTEVRRVLIGHQNAIGLSRLDKIETRVTKQMTEVTTSGLKFPTVIYQKFPNLIVFETDVPGVGKSWQGFDGQIGWAWSEIQGYRPIKGIELQQLLNSADMEGAMRLYAMCPLRRMLGEEGEYGHRMVGIALSTLAGPAGKLYFDVNTGQLVRMESLLQAGASGSLNINADFSDFRKVDGLTFAFRTVVTNPAVQMVVTILSIQHNLPLEDSLFVPKKED